MELRSILSTLPHTEDGRLFTLMPMKEEPSLEEFLENIPKEIEERGLLLNKKSLDWQTRELEKISLIDVVTNLLAWSFVVEIGGHSYDARFVRNEKNDLLSFVWSSSPSPHLCSYEFIERAFKEGVWYKVKKKKKVS